MHNMLSNLSLNLSLYNHATSHSTRRNQEMSSGTLVDDQLPKTKLTNGHISSSVDQQNSLEKLAHASPPSSGPVIALDLDDVLSQTNATVAAWHNNTYGTKLDISLFYYYYYWKNPGWGTPEETMKKVIRFYAEGHIHRTIPVPGAREGVQMLKDMGYRLIIVTAREKDTFDHTWNWVKKHFPGLIESVICTSAFSAALGKPSSPKQVLTKLTKAEVCAEINASLLIDDSIENVIQCANYSPSPSESASSFKPTPVLLFGDYAWNKRTSSSSEATHQLSYEAHLAAADGGRFWESDEELGKAEQAILSAAGRIQRVRDWAETIKWIQAERDAGRLL